MNKSDTKKLIADTYGFKQKSVNLLEFDGDDPTNYCMFSVLGVSYRVVKRVLSIYGQDIEDRKRPEAVPTSCEKRGINKASIETAAQFLCRHGYSIVEKGWECDAGEINIIALDEDDVVVFVEVNTRTNFEPGFPPEAVTPAKRERFERIATLFMRQYDAVGVPFRFDAISITLVSPDRITIRHHIDAINS